MLSEAGYLGERARAPGVVSEQLLERCGKPRVRLGFLVLAGDLVHGGDQRLRDELAAERTEIPVRIGEMTRRRRDKEFAAHRRCAPSRDPRPALVAGKNGHEHASSSRIREGTAKLGRATSLRYRASHGERRAIASR